MPSHGGEEKSTLRHRLIAAVRLWWRVALLGLATIGAYGLVLYSFGVFIVPIKAETGWSDSALAGAFSLSILVSGVGAILTGRLLDRVGSGPVMMSSLSIGASLLLVAASAKTLSVFILAWGVGGGVIGAGFFYNVTMAITTRMFASNRAAAFAVLTLIGGLASPIYFPLAGFMVEELGWRSAMRGMIALLVLLTLPAALLIRGGRSQRQSAADSRRVEGFLSVRQAFRTPEVRRMIAAFSLTLGALSAVQVYHVPAMQAAGLSLAAATTMAGIRGFLSLPGRAMLSPIVSYAGVRGAIVVMYGAMAVGSLALLMAGQFVFVCIFAVVTGLTFGTIAPLHALYAAEVFGERRIGTFLGVQQTVVGSAAALGPFLLGVTVDITGGYGLLLLASALVTCLAMWLLATSKGAIAI